MSAVPNFFDAIDTFRSAIAAARLTPPDAIEADGKLHRFSSNGKRGDLAGWYVLHGEGIPAGGFGCWRAGLTRTWCADIGRSLTDAEREEQRRRKEEVRHQREREEAAERERARERAVNEWEAAKPAPDSHPYLASKGVQANGLRVSADGRLLVPVRIAGEIHSLQYIAVDGEKRFLQGGRVSGGYHAIGKASGTVCIAEGFATAATVHKTTGHPVAVAFNCGNLESVARTLREKLPRAVLIVCADDDARTDGNPGLSKATDAARAIGGLLAVPNFGADRPDKATDFNDLAQHRGADAVRACIARAKTPDAEAWPEPLPLIVETTVDPYPLNALPGGLGAAVREVADFVQCPAALAACSALSTLSVAAQGLANVRRGPDLEGPVSLWLLAVAESGERKTECDKRFSSVLSDWEKDEAERIKPDLAKSRAELSAWETDREAVLLNIKRAKGKGKSADADRVELERLESEKPSAVRVPRLLLENETTESLAWNLARTDGWPSGGILSSEAGIVFGGHAMRRDTIMQNLSLLNKLWSGEPYHIGRRTSESFGQHGARLTMGLAVQPDTVQTFFTESRGQARGSGFAARFLIAWPESTQGTRFYREGAKSWPALFAYRQRLRVLLDLRTPIDERGGLAPPALDMNPAAFEAWRQSHDAIEKELPGELATIKDVASKAAENVARLAALFHLFECGPGGLIGAEHVAAAARIVIWHVFEARRFLGGMALPKPVSDAVKLDAWLVVECHKRGTDSIPLRDVMRLGPNSVRRKADLLAALSELSPDRARHDSENGTVRVNPALLRD